MLLIASVLVFIAGFQLFVLTEHTDRFFAWTIGFPLSAAFLGAGYWSAGVLQVLASRERTWAKARPAVPAVWIFSTLTTVATFLHLGVFRFGEVWAWAWLVVYVAVPIALGIILIQQLRVPGTDPPRVAPLPVWLRAVLLVQAAILLPIGIGLLIAPVTFGVVWPWDLTPLLARAIGAWLVGAGTVMLHIVWENDWHRTGAALLSLTTYGVLILVAIGRYYDAVNWNAHLAMFLLVVGSILAVGLYGTLVGWFSYGRASQPALGSD